jgi:hypothetical protein
MLFDERRAQYVPICTQRGSATAHKSNMLHHVMSHNLTKLTSCTCAITTAGVLITCSMIMRSVHTLRRCYGIFLQGWGWCE